jgi:hypothetical protein
VILSRSALVCLTFLGVSFAGCVLLIVGFFSIARVPHLGAWMLKFERVSFLFPGLFLASALLMSCVVLLGVSPFPESIHAGASLTGLAISQATHAHHD